MADVDGARTTQGADPATHPWAILRRQRQVRPMLAAEGLSALGDAVFWVGLLVWLLGHANGTALIALAAVARLGPARAVRRGGRRRWPTDSIVVRCWSASTSPERCSWRRLVWLVGVGASPDAGHRPRLRHVCPGDAVPSCVHRRHSVRRRRARRGRRERAVAIGAADRHVSGSVARLRGPVALRARMGLRASNATTFALSALLLAGVPRLRSPRHLRRTDCGPARHGGAICTKASTPCYTRPASQS